MISIFGKDPTGKVVNNSFYIVCYGGAMAIFLHIIIKIIKFEMSL